MHKTTMPTAKLYSTVAALPNHRGIMRAGHIRDSATSFLPGAQSRKGVGWGGAPTPGAKGWVAGVQILI